LLAGLCAATVLGYAQSSGKSPAGIPAKAPAPQAGRTLLECYALALKQSETIAIDKQLIKETEAHFLQAFSILMPHVSFANTESWLDRDAVTDTTRYHASQRAFTFSQTLFSGFKEFAAISGSKLERNQREKELMRAQQLLFTDVSDAFYLFVEQQEDLQTLEVIRDALAGRIAELRQREKLGRSRRSEIVSTEAQFYSATSQIELAKSQVELSRQLLEFLIGVSLEGVSDPKKEITVLEPEVDVAAKARLRPDVEAAFAFWGLAKKQVIVARSGFFPTVSFQNNYYPRRTTSPVESKWDAALTVDVPIFNGTQTFGDVKLANAKSREAELAYQRTLRLAVQDIRNAYTLVETSVAQLRELKKALQAAELNYFLQKEDYKLNLVNNLDVLQAIQTLQGTRRDHTAVFYDCQRRYWQLQVALGKLDLRELK